MIRATLVMTIKAGCEREFERAWQAVAQQTRQTPGSIRQSLLYDPQEPSRFVITSDWESLEAFRRFERSPEQDALTAPLRALRESAQMMLHHLVTHIEKDVQA